MLSAAVDESASPDHRLFALTAAVMDDAAMARLLGQLEPYATRDGHGRLEIHSYEQHPDDRRTVARIIEHDPALRAVVTVRAAIDRGAEEAARQACLSELMIRLHRGGVSNVVLDSRDNQRLPDHHPLQRNLDRIDLKTLRGLRNDGALPDARAMRIVHRESHIHKPLWVADALSYRVRSAIQHNQPGDLAGLTGKLKIVEASVTAERGQVEKVGHTPFATHLDRLQLAAAAINARDDMRQRDAPAAQDWAARLRALDNLIADRQDRGAPHRDYYTEQPEPPSHGHGRSL